MVCKSADGNMNPPPAPGPAEEELSEEKKCTLWVGGLSDQIDEEILFELFHNAGPVASVRIPTDRETKRKKPFAFVMFQHAESVPFAVELFRDVRLFGRSLRMQNKDTGAGMGGHGRDNRGHHQRSFSAPIASLAGKQNHMQYLQQQGQQQQQYGQPQMLQMNPYAQGLPQQQQMPMGFNPYGPQAGGMPQFYNNQNQGQGQGQGQGGYDQRSRDRERRHHSGSRDDRNGNGRDRSRDQRRDRSGGGRHDRRDSYGSNNYGGGGGRSYNRR